MRILRRGLGLPLILLLALAGPAVAAPPQVTESYSAFQSQVNAGQIRDAIFNKKAHTAHVVLRDGKREEISYPSHDFASIRAAVTAKGGHAVIKRTKKAVKKKGHRLRYIAAAIIVVALVGIGILLFLRRRRYLAAGGAGTAAAGPRPGQGPAASAAGDEPAGAGVRSGPPPPETPPEA